MHQWAQHESFVSPGLHYRLRILRGVAATGQEHVHFHISYGVRHMKYEIWTINCFFISMGDCSVFNTLTLSPARHYADTFIKTVGALWRGSPECRARHSRPPGVRSSPRRERAAVALRHRGDLDLVVRRVLAGAAGDHLIATGQ